MGLMRFLQKKLCITEVSKGKERRVESLFIEIMAEKIPKLGEEI